MLAGITVDLEKLKDRATSPLKRVFPSLRQPGELPEDEKWKLPKAHHGAFGVFDNPWPSATEAGSSSSNSSDDEGKKKGKGKYKHKHKNKDKDDLKRETSSWREQLPVDLEDDVPDDARRIKVVKPDFEYKSSSNEIQATWLGHSGYLVQLPPVKQGVRPITLLIDPIFTQRASPVEVAGPARINDPPCAVEDLPQIDFLFISHNHYDHLCADTVSKIIARSCTSTKYIVPLGVGAFFKESGVPSDQVLELDWWDEQVFADEWITHALPVEVKVTCVPAQHHSARKGTDKNTTLWAGWVVQLLIKQDANDAEVEAPRKTSIYFAGDTGYRASSKTPPCPTFKQIGQQLGPFDFSILPIWRGGTLSVFSKLGIKLKPDSLTRDSHATPEDAVCIHQDVRSYSSIAVHHATFVGSENEAVYPIMMLEEACKQAKVPNDALQKGGFGVCDIGQTLRIPVVDKEEATTAVNGHLHAPRQTNGDIGA